MSDLVDDAKQLRSKAQEKYRAAQDKARTTLGSLVQAGQAMQSLPDTLSAAGARNAPGKAAQSGAPAAAPADMSWGDIEAWLNAQKDQAVGYWRGYLQPKLRDLLK